MTKREIYDYLISQGLTPEGACGLMGNLQAESGCVAANAQNGMTSMTDAEYTAAVDNGSYDNFVYDAVGYGLVQWTYWSRKLNLLRYAQGLGVSIGDTKMQLDFCLSEIKNSYKSLWKDLTSSNRLLDITVDVCTEYERPAVNNTDKRYAYAKQFYAEFASTAKEDKPMTKSEAINKLIAVAKAEVGYKEKRSNAQLDDFSANAGSANWNKYARDIDEKYPAFYNGRKNGYAWCDIFVDWCFIQAFGYDNALKMLYAPERSTGAGCSFSAGFYRANNAFYTSGPMVGDQVFFGDYGNEGHTGIVIAVNGSTITTIEGNTSGGSGVDANGDGVYTKTYNTAIQYIPGYGRPNWAAVTDTTSDTTTTTTRPTLSYGSKGSYVTEAQQLLIAKGYSCGPYGADGDFGSGTKKAVLAIQADAGLPTTGVIDAATWEAILTEDEPEQPTSEDKTENDVTGLPTVMLGDKGGAVEAAQALLNLRGYSVGSAGVDGDFGASTLSAVKRFQAAKGLTSDGVVGGDTWAALVWG